MTVDLLEELDIIAARARGAQDAVLNGRAKNGLNALAEIERIADDAIRHGRGDDPLAPLADAVQGASRSVPVIRVRAGTRGAVRTPVGVRNGTAAHNDERSAP